jgi:hypothetical protein
MCGESALGYFKVLLKKKEAAVKNKIKNIVLKVKNKNRNLQLSINNYGISTKVSTLRHI